MRLVSLATCVLLSACSTMQKPPPESLLAFPNGKYDHIVQVEMFEPAQQISLRGVIESRADSIIVIGVSSFGTSVFRIEENFTTKELTKEIYIEALKAQEDKLMSFYTLLKQLLTAPRNEPVFEREGAKFQLSQPDENGIYRKIKIEHPQVRMDIEIAGYEF